MNTFKQTVMLFVVGTSVIFSAEVLFSMAYNSEHHLNKSDWVCTKQHQETSCGPKLVCVPVDICDQYTRKGN